MLRHLGDGQAVIPATMRKTPDPAQQTVTIVSAPYGTQKVAATSVLQTADMSPTDVSLGTLWVLTRAVALRFWSIYMATFAPMCVRDMHAMPGLGVCSGAPLIHKTFFFSDEYTCCVD